MPGGEHRDAADARHHLVAERTGFGRQHLVQHGGHTVVQTGVAPGQQRAGAVRAQFLADEPADEFGPAAAPVLDGLGVGRSGPVALGVRHLDHPVTGAGVLLDHPPAQPHEVLALLVLVEEEEDVGAGDGLDRLQGEVVRVARTDADDVDVPHAHDSARSGGCGVTREPGSVQSETGPVGRRPCPSSRSPGPSAGTRARQTETGTGRCSGPS